MQRYPLAHLFQACWHDCSNAVVTLVPQPWNDCDNSLETSVTTAVERMFQMQWRNWDNCIFAHQATTWLSFTLIPQCQSCISFESPDDSQEKVCVIMPLIPNAFSMLLWCIRQICSKARPAQVSCRRVPIWYCQNAFSIVPNFLINLKSQLHLTPLPFVGCYIPCACPPLSYHPSLIYI